MIRYQYRNRAGEHAYRHVDKDRNEDVGEDSVRQIGCQYKGVLVELLQSSEVGRSWSGGR